MRPDSQTDVLTERRDKHERDNILPGQRMELHSIDKQPSGRAVDRTSSQSHRTLSSSACEERGIHLLNPDDRRKREWVAVLQNDAYNHTVPYPIVKSLGETSSELEAGSSNLGRKTDLEHGHDQPQQRESRPQKKNHESAVTLVG